MCQALATEQGEDFINVSCYYHFFHTSKNIKVVYIYMPFKDSRVSPHHEGFCYSNHKSQEFRAQGTDLRDCVLR